LKETLKHYIMTNAQIFKAAHKLAKTFTGDYRACFSLALRDVYASLSTPKVERGNQYYKQAQELANELVWMAGVGRNDSNAFSRAFDSVGFFCNGIEQLSGFAANVAKTVHDRMNPYGKQVAYISPKQAWVLAVAAVENRIAL